MTSSPSEQAVVLTTARLSLRPITSGDADVLFADMADPEISRFMAWQPHQDVSETRHFVDNEIERIATGRGVSWLIFRGDEFCGLVSLIGILRRHRALTYERAELAYWLARRWQGQGLMREAIEAVLAYAFDRLRLHKVVVSHFSVNRASAKVIEGSGFRKVGEQVEEFEKAGVWYNHTCYELLEREFAMLRRCDHH
jgi:ribosomal-protein-alanine N-acetyltransferase